MGRIHPETTSWLRDKAHSPIASTILKSVQPLFHQPRVKFHCSQGYTFSLSLSSPSVLFLFLHLPRFCVFHSDLSVFEIIVPRTDFVSLRALYRRCAGNWSTSGPTLFYKVQQQRRDERIIGTRFEKYLEKYLSTRKGNLKGLLVASSFNVGENRMEYRRVFETMC